MISKASKQEAMLRKAEKELKEREMQESKLARELAEKEEMNLQLEEHFSSLQEEVEVKTKKLKKLWAKYQAAAREAQDLQEEFQVCVAVCICSLHESVLPSPPPPSRVQTERSDMLDTIRLLTRNVKLKEIIIQNFIPEETAKSIEKRAVWKEDEDLWIIPVSL